MDSIPKIIHYCWFGKGNISEIARKCINSWKHYLPDYSIKLWNEENFDLNINDYVREAYQQKKFAFVSDYVRLYALYQEGGIYMDTDVEVIKSLNVFLHHDAFSGFQTPDEIPTGLIASKPKHPWIQKNLSTYDNKRFIKNDGSFDLTTNVSIITNMSTDMGLIGNGQFQVFGDGVAMYPVDYFCAKDYKTGKLNVTSNTHTIHHFSGSWLPWSEKFKLYIRRKVGENSYSMVKKIIGK